MSNKYFRTFCIVNYRTEIAYFQCFIIMNENEVDTKVVVSLLECLNIQNVQYFNICSQIIIISPLHYDCKTYIVRV